jgi:hypothetical protein
MPYIESKSDRRKKLRKGDTALTAGELNYQLFYYIKHHNQNGEIFEAASKFLGNNPNYQKYNDVTGALYRCFKEIKRRLDIDANLLLAILDSYDDEIARYEDKKIIENGDVE